MTIVIEVRVQCDTCGSEPSEKYPGSFVMAKSEPHPGRDVGAVMAFDEAVSFAVVEGWTVNTRTGAAHCPAC